LERSEIVKAFKKKTTSDTANWQNKIDAFRHVYESGKSTSNGFAKTAGDALDVIGSTEGKESRGAFIPPQHGKSPCRRSTRPQRSWNETKSSTCGVLITLASKFNWGCQDIMDSFGIQINLSWRGSFRQRC
jgi:hypothetical protein